MTHYVTGALCMCEIIVTGGDIIVFLLCDDTVCQSDRLSVLASHSANNWFCLIHAQIPEC